MLKRISILTLLFFLAASPTWTEPWGGRTITLTPGTAIRVVGTRTLVSSLFFQMATGGTGVGYVLSAPIGVTCANGGAGTTLIATLQPATSTAPGGNATIPSNSDPAGGIDAQLYCVDGSAADGMIVSFNLR